MKSAILLKEKLRRRELTVGIMVTFHLWLEVIEMAIAAGLDYVIVDLEHTNHGDTLVSDACRMGRMLDFPVLIRPARTDAESVRLAADLGPCGMLLPMIESTQQLDGVRDGIWMPPRGQRRPGGHGNWWVGDYNYPTWKSQVEDHFIMLPQIESPRGVENAAAIAKHEITTALAIGPYDLSARLGVCWNPDDPKMVAARAKLRQAADAAGKPMWAIGDGQALRKEGYYFLCVAEPSSFLRTMLKNSIQQLRAGAAAASTSQGEKPFVP